MENEINIAQALQDIKKETYPGRYIEALERAEKLVKKVVIIVDR